ncbi:hypothetical protein [Chitinasiproducens palmae]|uniref:Uncharacterized protein n=1 Tax=Chitinasiproducens palmae TaxID=1770053 RepID=A0A1H2PP11_9BURK|nr:hypothetical protein [Chitinasiproducens palmae]SDV48469.1 hypothetical protein SAMN05216551_105117 [Chitinasiproducens palmae]
MTFPPLLHVLSTGNLLLLIPMALAGAILLGAVPLASRVGCSAIRAVGAVAGALLALIVLEALPALI